ncbi:MAG: superoxide dismutase [Maricaulaceae bacterium]
MFKLPDLPYKQSALEPHIGEETLSIHYGKHHSGYVDKLNAAIKDSGYKTAGLQLESVIARARDHEDAAVFNPAAQTWNHAFYWRSMAPSEGDAPTGGLNAALNKQFGDFAQFREAFLERGAGHFGSGWVWLAAKPDGTVVLHDTHDAETLADHDTLTPLWVCDVWEHAYYLDQQNDRGAYLEAFIDHLVDWCAAERLYTKATSDNTRWTYADAFA